MIPFRSFLVGDSIRLSRLSPNRDVLVPKGNDHIVVHSMCNGQTVIAHETLQNTEAEAIVGVPEWAKQWEQQSHWSERCAS